MFIPFLVAAIRLSTGIIIRGGRRDHVSVRVIRVTASFSISDLIRCRNNQCILVQWIVHERFAGYDRWSNQRQEEQQEQDGNETNVSATPGWWRQGNVSHSSGVPVATVPSVSVSRLFQDAAAEAEATRWSRISLILLLGVWCLLITTEANRLSVSFLSLLLLPSSDCRRDHLSVCVSRNGNCTQTERHTTRREAEKGHTAGICKQANALAHKH